MTFITLILILAAISGVYMIIVGLVGEYEIIQAERKFEEEQLLRDMENSLKKEKISTLNKTTKKRKNVSTK